jgi:hypothetical protein
MTTDLINYAITYLRIGYRTWPVIWVYLGAPAKGPK